MLPEFCKCLKFDEIESHPWFLLVKKKNKPKKPINFCVSV